MADGKSVTSSLEKVAYRVLLGSLVGPATVEACLAAEGGNAAAALRPDRVKLALDALAHRLSRLATDG